MTKRKVALIWGDGVSDSQLDIYKSIFDVVLSGDSLRKFDKDFSKCLSAVIIQYNYPTLYVADSISTVDENTLARMMTIMNISSHHSFVFLGELCDYSSFELCDKVSGDCCLINTQMPFLIKDPVSYTGTLCDVMAEWSYEASDYGYQSVKIFRSADDCDAIKDKNTVLLYLKGLSSVHGGANSQMLGILMGMINELPDSLRLYVCISNDVISYFNLTLPHDKCVVGTEYSLNDVYDLAFIPYHWIDIHSLIWLNEHAYHWMMWPMDMITRRCRCLKSNLDISTFTSCAKYCTSLYFFCKETLNDFNAFYYDSNVLKNVNKKIINIPAKKKENEETYDFPIKDYVFVTGNNRFKYKMISQILDAAKKSDESFIFLGTASEGFIAPNVYGYRGGGLSDDFVAALYKSCEIVVFPSVYEGFGLPVLEAINYGKDVILVDMPINHELASLVPDMKSHFHFIQSYSQLDEVIKKIRKSKKSDTVLPLNSYKRSWNDVAKSLLMDINNVFASNIRPAFLGERNAEFSVLKKYNVGLRNLRSIINMDFSSVKLPNAMVIYGCGYNGKALYHMIKNKCIIKCFIDIKAMSDEYDGVPIVKPNCYMSDSDDITMVITVNDNQSQIKENLKSINFPLKNMVTLSEFFQSL